MFNFLERWFQSILLWLAKRKVKKIASKLDATFKLDLNDLPVTEPAPPLTDDDDKDAFFSGFPQDEKV